MSGTRGSLRLLFDQNAPWPLRHLLPEHHISSAYLLGWDRLVNGDLLRAAEQAGFDVLVTLDRRIRYQQNLPTRRIGIVVLPQQQLDVLEAGLVLLRAAIEQAGQGAYVELKLPRPALKRRPPPDRNP